MSEPVNCEPTAAVFVAALSAMEKDEPFAMVTVVRTDGSTPQKPGAKLLVTRGGDTAGTLGGGCVENDLRSFAMEALRDGRPAHVRRYVLNESPSASSGMVCGGRMEFLIDPVARSDDYLPHASDILETFDGGGPVIVVSLVRGPRVGAKLLLRPDGSRRGSLGAPEGEEAALAAGRELLVQGGGFRLVSGPGEFEAFIEAYVAPPMVAVLGGGHIARALEPLAKPLGFRFAVIDDRPEYAGRERFAGADVVLAADFAKGLKELALQETDFIAVATRGHRLDDVALEAAVRTRARYVGLLGSRRKVALIFSGLMRKGLPRERVMGIHAPIGLDLGGRTPEEIALSIMAEIVMARYGGTGRPLNRPAS